MQRIPLTEVNHQMKQIRQFTRSDGLVVLTSHEKPALIVLDVERCLRLLCAAEQLAQLLVAGNLVEVVRAVSGADTMKLSSDHGWIKRALDGLKNGEDTSPKIRRIERSPGE
jgi:hypothetical protein